MVSSLFAIKVAHWPMVLKGVVSGKEKDGEQLEGQRTEDRDQRTEGSGSRTTGLLTTGLRRSEVGDQRWQSNLKRRTPNNEASFALSVIGYRREET